MRVATFDGSGIERRKPLAPERDIKRSAVEFTAGLPPK
jgi:hypothetical protein